MIRHIRTGFDLYVRRCLGKPAAVDFLAREFVDDERFDVTAFLVEKADLEAAKARSGRC